MRKTWNIAGKMTVCSLAAVMMMMGTGLGMTAHAEMTIDSIDVQEDDWQLVPESGNMDVLLEDAPAEQIAPAAGDVMIDAAQVVEIEEDMVPGAALPEFLTPSETAVEEIQEEKSETDIADVLKYEDEEVTVTVTATMEAQLPANTEVKVVKLEEGSEKYEAAKEAARQSLDPGADASYTFYDVTLESEGQVLDIADGTVSVQMEFKTGETEEQQVVSIEETEGGKVARNVTDNAAAGRAGSMELEY